VLDIGVLPPGEGDSGGSPPGEDTLFYDPDILSGFPGIPGDGAPAPRIELYEPVSGPVTGGTLVVMYGANFLSVTRVLVDGRPVTPFDVIDDATLLFAMPAATEPGEVSIKLSGPGGEATASPPFTYVADLRLRAIEPVLGPQGGGTQVRLQGDGFDRTTRVAFGDQQAVEVTVVSTREMLVMTPAAAPGPVDVRVTSPRGTRTLPDGFRFLAEPLLEGLEPAAGPSAGGNVVVVWGRGLSLTDTVRWGDAAGDVLSDVVRGSRRGLRVRVPAGASGETTVSVQTVDGLADLLVDGYLYLGAGTVTAPLALLPTRGPVSGGQLVTLVSNTPLPEEGTVGFGSLPATVESRTPTAWVVRSPPTVSPGAVTVRLQAPGVDEPDVRTAVDAYTYLPGLGLDGVTPGSGPTGGGGLATLQGNGLLNAERVFFGPAQARIVGRTDTMLEVRVPGGVPGPVDVEVESRLERARLTSGWRYEADLRVTGVTPQDGALSGNTRVVLSGEGFGRDCTVQFGSLPPVAAVLLDPSTLEVRTPRAPRSGPVDVRVRCDDRETLAPVRFAYYEPFSDVGGWWGGPIEGAVNVTVLDIETSQPVADAWVTLHVRRTDDRLTGLTNDLGQVTISAETVLGEQSVSVLAEGYAATTVAPVNARNITIFLTSTVPPEDGEPPEPPEPATITGLIRELDKIAVPGPNEDLVAIVRHTAPAVRGRNPPGTGRVQVAYSPGAAAVPFEMNSRYGSMAVVLMCGLQNRATGAFRPLYMDVARGLSMRPGDIVSVDLRCRIPMDNTMQFKFVSPPYAPGGPDVAVATPWLDFGGEGGIDFLRNATGRQEILTLGNMPLLTDPVLQDVTYFVDGTVENRAIGLPFSTHFARGITDPRNLVNIDPLTPPAELTFPAGPARTLVERRLEWTLAGSRRPSFYFAFLTDITQETTYWEVYLPGDVTEVNLPFLPPSAPPGLQDLPRGQLVLIILSVEAISFDFNEFSFNDFRQTNWRSFSGNGWVLNNPD
jgi:hypothetical protein